MMVVPLGAAVIASAFAAASGVCATQSMEPVAESLTIAEAPVTVVPPIVGVPAYRAMPTTLEPLGETATPKEVRFAPAMPNCVAHCGVGADAWADTGPSPTMAATAMTEAITGAARRLWQERIGPP